MKIIGTLLALLMCLRASAADSSGICEPSYVPGNGNDWIVLKGMTTGCSTDFITQDGLQVHILNLLFSPENLMAFSLNVTAANPSILIITSTSAQTIQIVLYDNPAVSLYVTNGTSVNFLPRGPVQTQVAPSTKGDAELLQWATDEFRGVTSFTTVRDPKTITFTGMKGSHLPSSCELKSELAAEKDLIELDVDTSSNDLKSCYVEDSGEEVHIINIPDDIRIRHVSVHLPPDSKVLLRGPPHTQWTIHANYDIKLLSNNHVFFNNLTMNRTTAISDDAADIMQKVFSYFNSRSVTSYSEIRLNISAVHLRIGSNMSHADPSIVSEIEDTTSAPSSSSVPIQMQLFLSPDYKSPLDPSSKVYSDKMVYAEISYQTYGGIYFSIKVISCRVRSMALERNMPFKVETCVKKDCPKRLSFSFELLQELPSTSWELECAVQLCYDGIGFCQKETSVKRNLQVIKSYIPSTNQCFDFGLSAVLGIAFGGFMIGVLLTGALWFIKIRTAYEGRVGESSCNKPRDDLPLEIR
ncbi:endoglin-like isoform X2 [Myxocyprinus asiaticus]|uniref:endoglin-like isoform X2 n=1 Tax=Myxocyprinus asiaticus TaxID=70543 RepID=UPI002221440B|nr:endoglin-like isoform X2 [Myxocyprinus asiaticus]